MFIIREDITIKEVFTHLQSDMVTAGFKSVYPNLGGLLIENGDGTFVVESTPEVNPLNETQKYRVRFHIKDADNSRGAAWISAHVATASLIKDNGDTTAYTYATTSGVFPRTMGSVGKADKPNNNNSAKHDTDKADQYWGQVFISRGAGLAEPAIGNAYKKADDGARYSYTLSVGDHGFVVYVWESTREAGQMDLYSSDSLEAYAQTGTKRAQLLPIFSFLCVQSPVDKDTGEPLLEDKSPIFCVYSNDNDKIRKFVVNESDVYIPTQPVRAGVDSIDSAAIINEEEQVAIKLDNKYLITFPNRVNTERFAYSEELDMIAYSSARVVGEDTVLELNVYNEGEPRRYRAMKSNRANNQGMRLFVVQNGAGVDDTDYIAAGGNSGDGGTVDDGSAEP